MDVGDACFVGDIAEKSGSEEEPPVEDEGEEDNEKDNEEEDEDEEDEDYDAPKRNRRKANVKLEKLEAKLKPSRSRKETVEEEAETPRTSRRKAEQREGKKFLTYILSQLLLQFIG